MTLIKSISGIRGTIGGKIGEGLNPIDIAKFSSAYAVFIKDLYKIEKPIIVVGRDARISGEMVMNIVCSTLNSMGCDVININYATTPTTEIAVTEYNAHGGIIITASHNPKQWNALKLLNKDGEFLNNNQGKKIIEIADAEDFNFSEIDNIGKTTFRNDALDIHINKIINLDLVDIEAIKNAKFSVAVDCVNSVGGIAIPKLLKRLGVNDIYELYCDVTGNFPHNPEPLPENLIEISALLEQENINVGFVVDPDVDRLAIVNEDGTMFGEEYTLVAVADYILQNKKGNTVSNLSSSRALRDVTKKNNGKYNASAVGEVNVVKLMKETNSIIGGEGNGGVIFPEIHYGRDSLVGIALFLTYLAKTGKKPSHLRKELPQYFISKNKIQLTPFIDVDKVLEVIAEKYKSEKISKIDGVKIDFAEGWVHLRKSNTEPIIRIYAEGKNEIKAKDFANKIISEIKLII